MASGGGGGGCACPGKSKLSSIATTKHAVRTVPAIELGGERGERGRAAAGTRAVPEAASFAAAAGAGDVPLPSRCKSFLAATWALSEGGNAWLHRRGGAAEEGRGEEGPGGAGRSEANCAAKERWRS